MSSGTVAVFTVPSRTMRLMRCCSPAAPRSRSTASSTLDDMRQQLPSLVADLRPGPLALQEVHAQFALQVAHGLAQRGLGQMQFLGGPAQRAEPGDGGDVFELFDPHGSQHAPVARNARSRETLSRPRECRLTSQPVFPGNVRARYSGFPPHRPCPVWNRSRFLTGRRLTGWIGDMKSTGPHAATPRRPRACLQRLLLPLGPDSRTFGSPSSQP